MLNGDSKELSLTPQINVLYHGLTLVDSGDLKFHVPQFFLLKKGLMTLTCLSGRLQCLLINSDFSKMKSALCVQRAPVVCRSCHFHHLHTDLSQTHTYRQNNVHFFFFFLMGGGTDYQNSWKKVLPHHYWAVFRIRPSPGITVMVLAPCSYLLYCHIWCHIVIRHCTSNIWEKPDKSSSLPTVKQVGRVPIPQEAAGKGRTCFPIGILAHCPHPTAGIQLWTRYKNTRYLYTFVLHLLFPYTSHLHLHQIWTSCFQQPGILNW